MSAYIKDLSRQVTAPPTPVPDHEEPVLRVFVAGEQVLPARANLNLVSGATAADNPATLATDITIAGGIASVAGTAPIVSSGGSTPTISISAASGSAAGSMSSSDYAYLARITAPNVISQVSGAGTSAALKALMEASSEASPLIIPGGLTITLDAPILTAVAPVMFVDDPRRRVTIKAGWTAGATTKTACDNPDNYMIAVRGVQHVSGTTTTLSARMRKDATTASFTSATGWSVGDWFQVTADNAGDDGVFHTVRHGQKRELFQITAIVGTTITTHSPAGIHHANGSVVQKWSPVLRPVIRGFSLDGNGKNVGVGLSVQYGLWGEFSIEGTDFTRSIRDAYVWKQQHDTKIIDHGNTNCADMIRCCNWLSTQVECDGSGLRRNANGYSRGKVVVRDRSNAILVHDCKLMKGVTGIQIDGGTGNVIRDCESDDMDLTPRAVDDIENGRVGSTSAGSMYGAPGLAINALQLVDMTGAELTERDKIMNLTVDGLTVRNCRHEDNPNQAAIWLEDGYGFNYNRITVIQDGYDWNTGAPVMNGVLFLDFDEGVIGTLTIRGGHKYGLITMNAGGKIRIGSLNFGTFSEQGNTYCAFYMNDDGTASRMRIDNMELESFDGYLLQVKSGWNDTTFGHAINIGSLRVSNVGYVFQDVIIAKRSGSTLFANGEVGELYDATGGILGVRTPTTADPADKVTVFQDIGASNSWVFCSRGPRRMIKTSAACTVGDHLIPVIGSRLAAIDAAKTAAYMGAAMGVLGAAGLVQASSVSAT